MLVNSKTLNEGSQVSHLVSYLLHFYFVLLFL